jgi:hypothetical protein
MRFMRIAVTKEVIGKIRRSAEVEREPPGNQPAGKRDWR